MVVDVALRQGEGCDWVEAGFLQCIEAPVEHALVLAPGGPLSEDRVHTFASALKGTPSTVEDVEASLERGMLGRPPNEGCPEARDHGELIVHDRSRCRHDCFRRAPLGGH